MFAVFGKVWRLSIICVGGMLDAHEIVFGGGPRKSHIAILIAELFSKCALGLVFFRP
jgi:hypothetical protein